MLQGQLNDVSTLGFKANTAVIKIIVPNALELVIKAKLFNLRNFLIKLLAPTMQSFGIILTKTKVIGDFEAITIG